MQIDIYAVPLIIGFVNAWIIACILLYRGFVNTRLSDKLLGFLLLAMSFLLLHYMFGYMGINILWNELSFFPVDTTFIIGPLFYFYLRAQVNTNFRFQKWHNLHFLPFIMYVVFHLVIFFQGRNYVTEWTTNNPNAENIMLLFMFISTIIYFIATLKLYRSYRKWLKIEIPNENLYSFRWYRNFIIATLITLVVMWTFTFVNIFGYSLDYNQNVWQYFFLSGVLVFIALNGYAQKQPNFIDYDPNHEINQEESEIDEYVSKEFSEVKEKILQEMEVHKLFLNPELSLGLLASEIGESKAVVSQAINKAFAQNFREFVNSYRISMVCDSLKKGQHKQYSLLGVAMNAGFNSKATFNRVFKEELKMTPLQYAEKMS